MNSAKGYVCKIYERLVDIYPDKPWNKSYESIERMRGGFLLRGGQAELSNSITTGLVYFDRSGYDDSDPQGKDLIEESIYFISQVIPYCESVLNGGYGPTNIVKRLRGAFSNDNDMRAIRFEFLMVNYFRYKGCSIYFPDESGGDETYDLLIQPPYGLPFEVECKSFSGDKGTTVSLDEGASVLDDLIKRYGDKISSISPGKGRVKIINIILSSPVPTKRDSLHDLTGSIMETIPANGLFASDVFSLEVKTLNDFDMDSYLVDVGKSENAFSGRDLLWDEALKFQGGIAGFIVHECGDGGLVCFRVSSSLKKKYWKEIAEVAKKAAKEQLTGKRPGVVALQFINESVEYFSGIHLKDNNFNMLANRYFKLKHITNFVFVGDILRSEIDNFPIKVDSVLVRAIRNKSSYFESGGIYLLLDDNVKL